MHTLLMYGAIIHTCVSNSHAGKLVNALLSGLSDRSAGVRKAYAGAAGYLVKVTMLHAVSNQHF